MGGALPGRTAIVTGAGRGLGRAHALRLAAEGAAVVVNDPAPAADGATERPADLVVREIKAAGGAAVADYGSCADTDAARHLVDLAVESFGGLDILVNNAGIVRDRMIVSMTDAEFDAVIAVHLRGHFAPLRAAANYWREQSKAGAEVSAAVIDTSSESGLFGAIGQANYAAAKAGIASLSLVAAAELGRYGVTVNTIAPRARTAMTVNAQRRDFVDDGFDDRDPDLVARFVAWLAGPEAREISGQTFVVYGSQLVLLQGWTPVAVVEAGRRPFETADYPAATRSLFQGRPTGVPPFAPPFPEAAPLPRT